MSRVYSRDLKNDTLDRKDLRNIDQLYKKAITVSSPEEQKTFWSQYRTYYDFVTKKLDTSLSNVQAKIADLTAEYDRYARPKEEMIKQYSEQNQLTDKAREMVNSVLAVVACIIVGILVVDTIIESGFGWGIAALFLCGVIGATLVAIISALVGIPFSVKQKKIESEKAKAKREFNAYLTKYRDEMNILIAIEDKFK